ncbi:MAG: DUF3013 family protein [Alkalibacterium sp.]|nr:DUF3013 family protein [Alkalibacterium sp.]
MPALKKGYVDAVLRYLNYTTKKGKVELAEFLENEFADTYTLTWKDSNLQNMIDTLKETRRYSEEKVPMELNDDKSFLEKIAKDDANGGVERV